MRLVSRGDTTVADAYLSPVLRRYVDRVAGALPGVRLQFMQSNGGLSDAASFHGKDAILSGPAGGIVGAAGASQSAGFDKIIAFDMGGTSTDVGHFAGDFERALDVEVGGVRLRTPILRIHTVAAGGGSIVHFDGVRLRVGPESAGANPGPASYRRGGPLTVTDCNVLLGRIQPDFFPGAVRRERRSAAGRRRRHREIQGSRGGSRGDNRAPGRQRGRRHARRRLHSHCGREHGERHQEDLGATRPRRHRLHPHLLRWRGRPARLPGRRRARHAARVHTSTGGRVVGVRHRRRGCHGHAAANHRRSARRRITRTPERALVRSSRARPATSLAHQGYASDQRDARARGAAQVRRHRLHALVAAGRKAKRRHPQLGSFSRNTARGMAFTCRGAPSSSMRFPWRRAAGRRTPVAPPALTRLAPARFSAHTSRKAFFEGAWLDTPFYMRDDLRPADAIDGPAIVCERHNTIVIEHGWRATLDARRSTGAREDRRDASANPPPRVRTPCCSRSSTISSWPLPSRWA